MSDLPLAIPKGSWVLVTGVTGYLASHITKQLLDRGYKVRGTTRNPSTATWVTDEMFADATRNGNLELAALDMTSSLDSDYDAVVKGVQGIVHPAAILTLDPNPHNVISPSVQGVTALLEAAARQPTVKRFVYTSSAVASFMPSPSEAPIIGRDSWNDVALAAVSAAQPPYDSPMLGVMVYAASKAMAEKAVWKFEAENKPHFEINVVSPYTLLGPVLDKRHITQNVPGWVKLLCEGDLAMIRDYPALYYVNVQDVALLHIASILDPDVQNARLHAWCTPFNWNDILEILRKRYPEKEFVDDLPNMWRINARIDDAVEKQLLKKWGGRDGWISFVEGIRETLDCVVDEAVEV